MTRFILIYHAPIDAMEQMNVSTPEEQQKGIDAWMAWAERAGDRLLDLGTPMGNGQALHPDGSLSPTGPTVAGFSMIQAETLEEAKKLLEGHPHLQWNAACSIEIYEAFPLPEM